MSDFGINLTNSTPSVNGSSEMGSSSKTTKLKEGLLKMMALVKPVMTFLLMVLI
ncbi:MAG: hypothetical protein L6V95_04505 [Candidatus Melainabacteria bacterium]|nr:MAG: hypothetical protein L6V95_04505 [Candidatus Melainabacteria bacterium]